MPNTSPPHGIFDLAASKTLGLTEGFLIGGLVVLALGIIALVFFAWRRKRMNRREPPRNPWDDLRQQLAPSLGQSAGERMGILNHALRKGLELKTKRPYTAWTSREILDHLQTNLEFSSDFQAQCAEFLLMADRVIFAHESWDAESRDRFERQISVWLDSLQFGRPL